MGEIRLAICDDSKHFINCMRLEIEDTEGIVLAGTANRASDLIDMIAECNPDVILLDIQMETASAGIDIIPKVKQEFPKLIIITLTVSEIDTDIFHAISNGADNYVLKSNSSKDIIKKVFEACRRESSDNNLNIDNHIFQKYINKTKQLQSSYNSLLFMSYLISLLTNSEIEILKELCQRNSYSDIAKKRFTTTGTVRTIVSRIVKKTNSDNINSLVEKIVELNIFEMFDI